MIRSALTSVRNAVRRGQVYGHTRDIHVGNMRRAERNLDRAYNGLQTRMQALNIPNDGVGEYIQRGNRALLTAGAGVGLWVASGLAWVGLGDVNARRKENDAFESHIQNVRDTLYNQPDYKNELEKNRQLTRESYRLETRRGKLEDLLTQKGGTVPVKPSKTGEHRTTDTKGQGKGSSSKDTGAFPPEPFKKSSQSNGTNKTAKTAPTQTTEGGTRIPDFKDWRSYYGFGVPSHGTSASKTPSVHGKEAATSSTKKPQATGMPLKPFS
ncbi:MAG: hypothetical protein ACKO37_07450 [Vampirovibrionales bacterium]